MSDHSPQTTDADLDAEVSRMVETDDVRGLHQMAYGGACACRGPQDGASACPCEMDRRAGGPQRRWAAVARQVVPYWLQKERRIVRRKESSNAG